MKILKIIGLVALSALALALGASSAAAKGSAAQPTATASKACSLAGAYRSFPPASYVTSLKAKRVSCSKAKSVIAAYHSCRGSASGRCKKKVQKFRCTEGKRSQVPGVQYNSTVTCKKGKKKVVSSYTQNL